LNAPDSIFRRGGHDAFHAADYVDTFDTTPRAAAIGMNRDLTFANEIYFACRSLIRSSHAHSRFLLWFVNSRVSQGQWMR